MLECIHGDHHIGKLCGRRYKCASLLHTCIDRFLARQLKVMGENVDSNDTLGSLPGNFNCVGPGTATKINDFLPRNPPKKIITHEI